MPFFCRYQDFVEQHKEPEPQAEPGRAVHLWMTLKTGKKTSVLCMPLFSRPLGILHL